MNEWRWVTKFVYVWVGVWMVIMTGLLYLLFARAR